MARVLRWQSAPTSLASGGLSFLLYGLLSACATRPVTEPSMKKERTVLYASVGSTTSWYDVDLDGRLASRGSIAVPANVQFAWPSGDRRRLYVVWSDMAPGSSGTHHGVTALVIDSLTGALSRLGPDARLRSRPIHVTSNAAGTALFVAHNDPSGLTVIALQADGSLGPQPLSPTIDAGVYAHQVRVDPSDSIIYLVTRGIGPTVTSREQPGAIKLLRYANGSLSDVQSVAPGRGFGFQPRNLDFHPSRPWVYVALERQNMLQMFERLQNGRLSELPRLSVSTLDSSSSLQTAGAVIVHPSGRFAYVANRAAGTRDLNGVQVFAGGNNSIAVFALDSMSGAPTLVVNVPTQGFSPRTMALDAEGRWLVVANQVPLAVSDSSGIHTVSANLALFRVAENGQLEFVRKYDVETRPNETLFWVGILHLQ